MMATTNTNTAAGEAAASAEARPGYRAAKRLAALAGLFSITVAAMMFGNYWHLKRVDPLNSPQLVALRAELADEPGAEPIKEQIRALDLELRNEYFRLKRFSETGAYLLLIGAVVAVASLKLAVSYHDRPPMPSDQAPGASEVEARLVTQKRWAVGVLGIALIVSAVVLAATMPLNLTRAQAVDDSQAGGPADGGAAPTTPAATAPPTAEQLAANWPGFRGPGGLGVSQYDNAPESWNGADRTNILWKTPLPLEGKNSVVVWNDRLFCTGANATTRQVYCLDTATGRMVWLRRVDGVEGSGEAPDVTDDTGYAAPTGVTDGHRFYAVFANGDLAAFDFAGERIWAVALGTPKNHYGHSTSLAMHEDLLLVQLDQGYGSEGLSAVLAFDGATGEQVWKTDRDVGASWTSPIVIHAAGRSQFITVASPSVISYDPRTGTELWKSDQMSGEVAPGPIFAADLVLAVAPMDQLVAVRPDGSGDVTESHLAWSMIDDVPDIVSPLSDGERVYMLTTSGVLSSCSIKDGKVIWNHDYEMTFRSSPGLAGGRLYLTNSKGVTFIVRAGDTFEQLGQCELGEPVDSTLALLDGRIYLRTDKHAYAIGDRAP